MEVNVYNLNRSQSQQQAKMYGLDLLTKNTKYNDTHIADIIGGATT